MFCLSPFEAMIKGVSPDAKFDVVSTLWDSEKCVIKVKI